MDDLKLLKEDPELYCLTVLYKKPHLTSSVIDRFLKVYTGEDGVTFRNGEKLSHRVWAEVLMAVEQSVPGLSEGFREIDAEYAECMRSNCKADIIAKESQ